MFFEENSHILYDSKSDIGYNLSLRHSLEPDLRFSKELRRLKKPKQRTLALAISDSKISEMSEEESPVVATPAPKKLSTFTTSFALKV